MICRIFVGVNFDCFPRGKDSAAELSVISEFPPLSAAIIGYSHGKVRTPPKHVLMALPRLLVLSRQSFVKRRQRQQSAAMVATRRRS
jgi:hypothetical protein